MTDHTRLLPSLETAVLGGGCFWCLEAVFDELDGVHSVESGYAGGTQRRSELRRRVQPAGPATPKSCASASTLRSSRFAIC